MNWCWPGRAHVIARRGFLYVSVTAFGRRWHVCKPELPHWRHWSDV